MSRIETNLAEIKQRIETACKNCGRNPDEITLVAVSKMHPVEAITIARETGQLHFGENKVQELVPKMEAFENDPEIVWHMIGTLQTNKIKYLAKSVHWIHSVPKLKALKEIQKRAASEDRVINVLIQVNISDEDQKSGCEPDDLPGLIQRAEEMPNLVIRGLMGMASFTDNMDQVRSEFRLLRTLFDQEKAKNYKNAKLEHLSMGMTNDLEVAIEEGSTMLRIGTAIFGER